MQIPNYKNLITSSVIILIALVISANIYKKQSAQLAKLNETKQTEEKKNLLFSDIAKLEKAAKAYKQLYSQKNNSELINYLNNLAQESGVEIISLKPGNGTDAGDYISQPFILSIRAQGYHKIGAFISKLESSSDIYAVDSLDMRPSTGGTEKIEVNLVVEAIFFKG